MMAGSPGGTGVYGSAPPKPNTPVVITDPKHNPYPGNPNMKFMGGAWVDAAKPAKTRFKTVTPPSGTHTPGTGGAGGKKSAYQLWLAGKGAKQPGTTDPSTDPLAGQPGMYDLTAYPTIDPSTLPDGSDVPDAKAHPFVSGRAQLLNPTDYQAGVEKSFQPLINAITGQQSRLQGGIGQANKMLNSTFGEVNDSSLKGAQTITANNQQSNQTLTQLAANLASVAGGDPTAAAAVGQASANQISANTDQANLAARTSSDQATAAEKDLGLAKLGYKSSTDKAITDLATAAGQARSEGKQKGLAALEEALGFNSGQQTAQVGRDVAKQEAWLAGQMAGPQITASKLNNIRLRQGLALDKHTALTNDWKTQTDATRSKYSDALTGWTDKLTAKKITDAMGSSTSTEDLVKSTISAMTDSKGPAVDPGTMYSTILHTVHTAYPDESSAAAKKLALQYVGQLLPKWNADHSKGQRGDGVKKGSGMTWKTVNGAPALVKINS